MSLRTIWRRIEWILSEVTGPFRFGWRIAHLWWVRCKWKWAGRRLLCGMEAVKYLHVGAVAALNEVLPFENKGHSREYLIRLHVLRDAARIMQVLTANCGRE